jgi:hypothetical protein
MIRAMITRRDFLRQTGAAALVATAGLPLAGRAEERATAKVVLVRHQGVLDGSGTLNRKILEQMLDEAMVALTRADNAAGAWRGIVKPSDVVGIKTNVWKSLRTPTELEGAMRARLVDAGVKEANIAIDDRGVLSNPVFANATALINTRPMRAHAWSGVGGCLKNYIMFSPSPPDYHPDSCIDLGALWKLPAVKGKTRLNVLVMLTPQFHCLAPHHFDREFVWPYHGMLVGTDPVAVDAVGLSIIEAKRRLYFKDDSPMRPPAKHIRAAEEKHGVGVADLSRIEIVRLGWKDGVLI